MPYRLVIFDFDGTLADSSAWFREVFGDVAKRFGFRNPEPREIDELRGQSSREIVRRLGVPAWKLPLIARHVRRLAMENTHRIALFPGIEAMLDMLHARGIHIGIVSSNAEETIRRVIGPRLADSIDYFECGAAMFGKARRLRRVLKRCGIPASEAIFIGDETRDVEAARQAGVAAAVALWGYAAPAAFEGLAPLTLFPTVEEMTSFFAA